MNLTSENTDLLDAALAKAQAEMPTAAYNKENPHFKNRYADLAAIREATLPSLTKYGIAITQIPFITDDGLIVLVTRLMHKGQWIQAQYPVGGSTPQARGSELTYARRYSWSSLTGVAADEDDDAEVAEASAKRGASEQTLGDVKTLSKEKSRPLYEKLIKEMRVYTSVGQLQAWGLTNSDRIHSMHKDFQKWFTDEYKNRRTALLEGVDEEGKTIGEQIDDEVPEAGGSAT